MNAAVLHCYDETLEHQGITFEDVIDPRLVVQPQLRFDDREMWTLDDVRGHTLGSPLQGFRALKPGAERDAAIAEYRKGFKIAPCH